MTSRYFNRICAPPPIVGYRQIKFYIQAEGKDIRIQVVVLDGRLDIFTKDTGFVLSDIIIFNLRKCLSPDCANPDVVVNNIVVSNVGITTI